MRAEVYYNLHKKCLSVRAINGPRKGRVVQHTPMVVIGGAKFIVQPAGRERVIREGRKNVHAFVRGNLLGTEEDNLPVPSDARLATYNPFRYNSFVDKETGQPVYYARFAFIIDKEVWYQ